MKEVTVTPRPTVPAILKSKPCEPMGEFEADRFGGFVCLDYYICSFRRHRVVPFRGDEVLDGKGAVRAGDGHGIASVPVDG